MIHFKGEDEWIQSKLLFFFQVLAGPEQELGLTAVVDRVGDHGIQPARESSITVGQEGGEHQAHHTQVHLLGLAGSHTGDEGSLVLLSNMTQTDGHLKCRSPRFPAV